MGLMLWNGKSLFLLLSSRLLTLFSSQIFYLILSLDSFCKLHFHYEIIDSWTSTAALKEEKKEKHGGCQVNGPKLADNR